jgi:hypothetical protein
MFSSFISPAEGPAGFKLVKNSSNPVGRNLTESINNLIAIASNCLIPSTSWHYADVAITIFQRC